VILDLLHEAKKTGDYQPLMHAIPYTRWLGVTAVEIGGEVLGKLSFKDELIGNPSIPAIHGGILGALLESTAIVALFRASETVTIPKVITVTVDYLRSAKPHDTYAKATITRLGRRVVTVHVEAWQDDRAKLVATANLHLLVSPAD